ncbi:hypothetical protein [Streptomyces olivaceiscleroticus]|uniref:Ferredoxin n=1 Tax=Streptomyces olivaceiscleroticus TaxID=68245 RepID=A0ABN1BLV5_9ACTN
MNTPLTVRDYLAGIPADTKPYIPELHQDDCEDTTCARCVDSPADETAKKALNKAGAQCGSCGSEPGDRDCPDCERCYQWYVKALRAAGWAPRSEVLTEAAALAESLRQFEPAIGARKSAQISENVGILRVADKLRHVAAEGTER